LKNRLHRPEHAVGYTFSQRPKQQQQPVLIWKFIVVYPRDKIAPGKFQRPVFGRRTHGARPDCGN